MDLKSFDGFAGIAAIINGLLLWPVVRALKSVTQEHGTRLSALERITKTQPKKRGRK